MNSSTGIGLSFLRLNHLLVGNLRNCNNHSTFLVVELHLTSIQCWAEVSTPTLRVLFVRSDNRNKRLRLEG